MKYVYCFGMVHPSKVYLLCEDCKYPEANGYGEVGNILTSAGGEAVNSAIMLSKLGIPSKLDGTWIVSDGMDDIKNLLSGFKIDISRLKRTKLNGASEIIIADGLNRTCFGNFDNYKKDGKKWNTPKIEDIKGASMVALDPYFDDDTTFIAKTCIDNKIPYVTIDCNHDDFVAMEAEAIIISEDHREWNYSGEELKDIFIKYSNNCKGLVIFTLGHKDVWYARKGEPISKMAPYSIEVKDTTGAGDTFRSGIIYGLLYSMSDYDTVAFANAVAACVCLSAPHAINAPDLKGVLEFIKDNKK